MDKPPSVMWHLFVRKPSFVTSGLICSRGHVLIRDVNRFCHFSPTYVRIKENDLKSWSGKTRYFWQNVLCAPDFENCINIASINSKIYPSSNSSYSQNLHFENPWYQNFVYDKTSVSLTVDGHSVKFLQNWHSVIYSAELAAFILEKDGLVCP